MTAYDLKEDFFDIYDEHPLSREDAEDAFDAWKASIPDDKAYDPFRGLAKATASSYLTTGIVRAASRTVTRNARTASSTRLT